MVSGSDDFFLNDSFPALRIIGIKLIDVIVFCLVLQVQLNCEFLIYIE